jgi:lysozyme
MKMGPEGLALVKRWEGCEKKQPDGTLVAYNDGEGVATIGWGSTKGVHFGMTCTMAEAETMLARELESTEHAVLLAVKVPLTQTQFDALVSWAYNVGVGWLGVGGHKPATFVRKLNAGDYNAVPAGLLQFSRGISGKPYPGLLARRRAEAELWNRHAAPLGPPVPEPAPEPQPRAVRQAPPVVTGSRKLTLIGIMRAVMAMLGLGGVLGEGGLDPSRLEATKAYFAASGAPSLLTTMAHHPGAALALCGILGFLAFEALRQWHIEDFIAGRWTPSGDDQ